jgi:hypothetical protein
VRGFEIETTNPPEGSFLRIRCKVSSARAASPPRASRARRTGCNARANPCQRQFAVILDSSWAVLEEKITIVSRDHGHARTGEAGALLPSGRHGRRARSRRSGWGLSCFHLVTKTSRKVPRPSQADAAQPPVSPVLRVGCARSRRSRSGLPRLLKLSLDAGLSVVLNSRKAFSKAIRRCFPQRLLRVRATVRLRTQRWFCARDGAYRTRRCASAHATARRRPSWSRRCPSE